MNPTGSRVSEGQSDPGRAGWCLRAFQGLWGEEVALMGARDCVRVCVRRAHRDLRYRLLVSPCPFDLESSG